MIQTKAKLLKMLGFEIKIMQISYTIIHAGLKLLIAAAVANGFTFHEPTEILYKQVTQMSYNEDYFEETTENIMWVNCYKIDPLKHSIYILDADGNVIEFDGSNWEILESY